MGNVADGKIKHTAWGDTELTKCILNDMVEEAGIKLYLHSWGTQAIVEDGTIKGVMFESKSGRQAVIGNVVIDGTGDGDLLEFAGAEYDGEWDPKSRSSMLALVFRIGNCDYQKYCDFQEAEPERFRELLKGISEAAGTMLLPLPSPRNDVMWVNNWIPGLDCTNVEDLTRLEVDMRKIMRKGFEYIKKTRIARNDNIRPSRKTPLWDGFSVLRLSCLGGFEDLSQRVIRCIHNIWRAVFEPED